ncbi:MAG: 3-hydroxyacyl-CoA dehydrogenase NAD-binding domain-containing protein [Steroidobacteraceae bacterium]|jgi:3-hydroxyacyl-CoA dehydrogenase/enoyl-CoA hydratase/3-hydroxybutyryl-CoA epimerase|nr:3-hydroxyacyl-CoA dehydrogenase NAD-binding domain-containing protein [Steroidobacteraceae bacterium]
MNPAIRIEIDADGIAILTIDVPGTAVNVITPGFQQDLAAAVERIATDAGVRGVIITSAKRDFMAGADLKDLVTAYDRGVGAVEAAGFSASINRIYRRLETCGKPVAAAINGLALGGGLELALACHYRVLADTPKAVVGLPEVKVGLVPGAGGTQRLPRLIGIAQALPLMLEGRQVKPADALKLGIVHEIAPTQELIGRARAWLASAPEPSAPWDRKGFKVPGGAGMQNPALAQTFMVGSAMVARETWHNYPAPAAILSAVYEGSQLPFERALAVESKYFGKLLAGPVARNLMRTLFVNKGLADGLVRRPEGVPRSRVARLGVLGAGMMGAGIAHVSAEAGIDVVLLDTTVAAAEKGKDYSRKLLAKGVERGRLTQQEADAMLARVQPTADYARLDGYDLVIEAVFESREIKADVTARAETVIPRTAVFASNTSTLPISGLARASRRPTQFIGIHFFSPVDKMPLVEVIVGKLTTPETLARALDYVAQLRKTPIVVNDSRGFFTSRIFGTYVAEGQAMLAEGVAPALIENAARMAGLPVGPLAVSDEVTIDLQWSITRQAEADLGPRFTRPVNYDVMQRMVELGRLGRRQGSGFYDYPAGAPKRLWAGLAQQWPVAASQPAVQDLVDRFLYVQALESVRCLEEGVITHPADADLGSVLGVGYPAWTGGVLSFIETVGLREFVARSERLARLYGPRFRPTRRLREQARDGRRFHQLPGAGAAA